MRRMEEEAKGIASVPTVSRLHHRTHHFFQAQNGTAAPNTDTNNTLAEASIATKGSGVIASAVQTTGSAKNAFWSISRN